MKEELPKCMRCGMCCILGPCGLVEEDENDVCKALIVHEDLTISCKLVEGNKLLFIGSGCMVRSNPALFAAASGLRDFEAVKRELLKERKPNHE